jgi:hypothetical protein
MREDPNGASLLQAASTLLREDILKALPAEKRHGALMIANAMSIAMRQLEQGDAPEQAELQALRTLLGSGAGDGDAPMRSLLLTLNRQLAGRIRCGDADPGTTLRAATLAHLRQTARQRLVESSPKVLKALA